MKFIYALFAIASLSSFVRPWGGAESLHILNGANDRPSGQYSLKLVKQEGSTYHLYVKGVPAGRRFKLVHRNAKGQTILMYEGVHLGEGKMMDRESGFVTDCEAFTIAGFERGEPSEFLFVDPKQNTSDAVFFLPHPSEPAVANGMQVSMQFINNDPMTYLFSMENLTPGEKIHVRSIAGSDRKASTFVVPESGQVSAFVMPKEDGTFEVQRSKGGVAIAYPCRREPSNPMLPPSHILLSVE